MRTSFSSPLSALLSPSDAPQLTRSVHSTITTASAPSGNGAPVAMRHTLPRGRAVSDPLPAVETDTTSYSPSPSAECTAYPSFTEARNGGYGDREETVSARTKPHASDSGRDTDFKTRASLALSSTIGRASPMTGTIGHREQRSRNPGCRVGGRCLVWPHPHWWASASLLSATPLAPGSECLVASTLFLPERRARAWGMARYTREKFSRTALGLPGKFSISVPLRVPAAGRLSMARGVIFRDPSMSATTNPGASR
mmetsp:Transcript_25745/g.72119  ORF Transcript_25745/g.72119 Transcript_25745/m.72119 type:complete len:255 (+) Transcript_25745:28-792(+)